MKRDDRETWALISRAMREAWPVPQGKRESVMEKLWERLDEAETTKEFTDLLKIAIAATKVNVDQAKLLVSQGIDVTSDPDSVAAEEDARLDEIAAALKSQIVAGSGVPESPRPAGSDGGDPGPVGSEAVPRVPDGVHAEGMERSGDGGLCSGLAPGCDGAAPDGSGEQDDSKPPD